MVAAARLEAVDRGDVGVIELGEELRFALEARQALLVLGEGGRQDLDRHLALQARVGGAIDLAHAALAELGGDLVGAEALADHRVPGVPGAGVRVTERPTIQAADRVATPWPRPVLPDASLLRGGAGFANSPRKRALPEER